MLYPHSNYFLVYHCWLPCAWCSVIFADTKTPEPVETSNVSVVWLSANLRPVADRNRLSHNCCNPKRYQMHEEVWINHDQPKVKNNFNGTLYVVSFLAGSCYETCAIATFPWCLPHIPRILIVRIVISHPRQWWANNSLRKKHNSNQTQPPLIQKHLKHSKAIQGTSDKIFGLCWQSFPNFVLRY